jgi:hypothetical protein
VVPHSAVVPYSAVRYIVYCSAIGRHIVLYSAICAIVPYTAIECHIIP